MVKAPYPRILKGRIMTSDNGHNEVKEDKHCPFLNNWCIKERCALFIELRQNTGGLQQKYGACSFSAAVLILSEINQKTQAPPPQMMRLPGGLFRGG